LCITRNRFSESEKEAAGEKEAVRPGCRFGAAFGNVERLRSAGAKGGRQGGQRGTTGGETSRGWPHLICSNLMLQTKMH